MANVIQTFPKGTGGGHTILDNSGAAVIDRKELQFKGLNVTDNSTDEVTEVEGVGLNQDSLNDIANANISNTMVGSGNNYSASEQIIGRWLDGRPLYQRYINCGAAPNAATDNSMWYKVADAGVYNYINLEKAWYTDTSGGEGSLPYSLLAPSYGIFVSVNNFTSVGSAGAYVGIATGRDRSGFNIHVVIQYTKTADATS